MRRRCFLGSRSMVVEAEICSAASEVLTKLGFDDFVIRINHRHALTGVLQAAGVAPDKHDAALVALDKLDKIGRAGVEKEFAERSIDASAATSLLDFFGALVSLDHAAEVTDGKNPVQQRKALNRAILGRFGGVCRRQCTGRARS